MVRASTDHMHPDLWSALRRVIRGEAPGSPQARDALMRRGLIEWVPGQSGLRPTEGGARAIEAKKETR